MRPEHEAANRLIDIALTGDRDAYRSELARLRGKCALSMYHLIVSLARMQYRMETQDHRYTGWRAAWKLKHKGVGSGQPCD